MKVFFQKNSEQEKCFKFFVNVKKKTFKKAVDRNKIKRRIKHIMKNIISVKNEKFAINPEKYQNKKKIIVLYEFEKEDLTINFSILTKKVETLVENFINN